LFWQEEARLGRIPGYDKDDWECFLQKDWTEVGRLILITLLQRFRDAYLLSQAARSSVDFEDEIVYKACGMFVQSLHNCTPFATAFKNKPKALAIMEIASQRQSTGSSLLFSQVTRETAHRSQRDAKNRSNFKSPEMWVMMAVHRRYSMRIMLEGGTLNVYDIPIDEGDTSDVHPSRISGRYETFSRTSVTEVGTAVSVDVTSGGRWSPSRSQLN
jgi:hypothetical protein